MARIGRLAGALLAESGEAYFLVGNTKAPCDWATAGFEPPVEVDARKAPFVRLARCGPVQLGAPVLAMELEGEDLARALAQRFVIERNGSVSERLWRLVVHRGEVDDESEPQDVVDARWLGEVPAAVWQVVRDSVLRCL